jgi:hypothetical protein
MNALPQTVFSHTPTKSDGTNTKRHGDNVPGTSRIVILRYVRRAGLD